MRGSVRQTISFVTYKTIKCYIYNNITHGTYDAHLHPLAKWNLIFSVVAYITMIQERRFIRQTYKKVVHKHNENQQQNGLMSGTYPACYIYNKVTNKSYFGQPQPFSNVITNNQPK